MASKLLTILVLLAASASSSAGKQQAAAASEAGGSTGSHFNHHRQQQQPLQKPIFQRNDQQQQDQQQLAITMPDIRPVHADQYLCMAHRLPANPEGQFIVGFNPRSDASRVHHMLVYGCQRPGIFQRDSPNFVWDCGEMHSASSQGRDMAPSSFEEGPVCQLYGKQQILYGWALDAPALKLPEGVGFKVGGRDTDINFLVLQVHYGHFDAFRQTPDLTDNSGLILDLKVNKPTSGITKQAGVLLLISLGYVLQGRSKHEIYCDIEEDIEIHPFRFRVHTHKLGTKVIGAKLINQSGAFGTRDRSVIIGARDPQEPQTFYPVEEDNLTIKRGDTVYASCEYNNNKTHIVNIGQTGADEMCNFYLMYWTESSKLLRKGNCFGQNPRRFVQQTGW